MLTLPLEDGGEEIVFFGERWPDWPGSGWSGMNTPPEGTKASGLQALVPVTFDSGGIPLPMAGIPQTFNLAIKS